jgi:hypothetical protein
MIDETEPVRRTLVSVINDQPGTRVALEQEYGQVWDTQQLSQDFEVRWFSAPYVIAIRKSDGAPGSLEFQHYPRFYYNFVKDD